MRFKIFVIFFIKFFLLLVIFLQKTFMVF